MSTPRPQRRLRDSGHLSPHRPPWASRSVPCCRSGVLYTGDAFEHAFDWSRMRLAEHQVRLLMLCKVKGVSWHLVAREAQRPDGLDRLWSDTPVETSPDATKAAELLARHRSADQQADLRAAVQAEI